MTALALLLCAPLLMWLGQAALLRATATPMRWQLGGSDLPDRVKAGNRVILNVVMIGILVAYPLLRGVSPIAYYAAFFPFGEGPAQLAAGLAMSVLYLALLYAAWGITDNVRFSVRHSARKLTRRLAFVPLMSIGAATIEELLFRAMLLAGLLESFPARVALPIGVFCFAAAHYVRSVKRYWTFPGHLALGSLFCVAFLCTGNLWLSIGLHAGGILMLMGLRPFVRYVGPSWLVGASIFPYAGVVGFAALVLMTINVWLRFGGNA
ncbi:MAG: lysostaphin resistance A-like protein [Phycisphaerae bacterium]